MTSVWWYTKEFGKLWRVVKFGLYMGPVDETHAFMKSIVYQVMELQISASTFALYNVWWFYTDDS